MLTAKQGMEAMAEISEKAIEKRAKALAEADGYTWQIEFQPVRPSTPAELQRWLSEDRRKEYARAPSLGRETAMPKGPRGEKRPADVIGMSVKVMRIATGEETEDLDRAKSAAAELGSRGGKARAASLSQERRAEIAKRAARARWKK